MHPDDEEDEDFSCDLPRSAWYSRLVYWVRGPELYYYVWLYSRYLQGLDHADGPENWARFQENPTLPTPWRLAWPQIAHLPFLGISLADWASLGSMLEYGAMQLLKRGWRGRLGLGQEDTKG